MADYSSVGNWLDSIIRNEKCYHSICIADESEVMIQRGHISSVREEERIRQAKARVSGGFWIGPRQAKRGGRWNAEGGYGIIVLLWD